MSKSDELEFLKIELENVIQGMTICRSVLSADEANYLSLFQRCKSVLDRIRPAEKDTTDPTRQDICKNCALWKNGRCPKTKYEDRNGVLLSVRTSWNHICYSGDFVPKEEK